MRKPEPLPPEILRDIGNEVIGLWRDFMKVIPADMGFHNSGIAAALLTQAAIVRVNGLYPMYEVRMGPPKEKPHE